MANKVIKTFRDKESKEIHQVGDLYQHEDADRVAFLVEEGYLEEDYSNYPKHTGGGWYELSNGEKVKGKDEAVTAESELKEQGE